MLLYSSADATPFHGRENSCLFDRLHKSQYVRALAPAGLKKTSEQVLRSVRSDLPKPPLWRCKKCDREFANRNQSHSCGRYTLAHHFENKPPAIRRLFSAFADAVAEIGPVRVLPEKTRIAFQVRMSFAQVTLRRAWLDGHIVLARRLENPRFRSVETFSPRNHLHTFRLNSIEDIDDEFRAWLAEAYKVGAQEHLRPEKRD